jgi:hypothetical protein
MKVKAILLVAACLIGITAALIVRHRTQAQLHDKNAMLTEQKDRLAELAAEHQRLSNLLTQSPTKNSFDSAELSNLREEAESLRRRTNELATGLAKVVPKPKAASRTARHGDVLDVVSASESDEYKQQLYKLGRSSPHVSPLNIDAFKDAQNLAHSLRTYASQNGGRFPASFEEAASYRFKESYYRIPQASEYEIVYHGTLDELTNIPGQTVALLRERQPWPTPNGKWGRLYATANGSIKIVESDDNFQTWEAEYIIPPPGSGQ